MGGRVGGPEEVGLANPLIRALDRALPDFTQHADSGPFRLRGLVCTEPGAALIIVAHQIGSCHLAPVHLPRSWLAAGPATAGLIYWQRAIELAQDRVRSC